MVEATRLDMNKMSPEAYRHLLQLEGLISQKIEPTLYHLIKLRASQINGCAYCIDMHWKDARANGETEQRLYGLDAWEESPYYTDRERAAFAWIEAVTNLHDGHVSDGVYDKVKGQFNEKEITDLTVIAATINAWNRLAIAGRSAAGSYKPKASTPTG